MQAMYDIKTGDIREGLKFLGYDYDRGFIRYSAKSGIYYIPLANIPVPGMRVKINGNRAVVVRQNGVCVLERGVWTFQEGLEGLTLEEWEPDQAWDAFSGQLTVRGRYLSNGFYWNGREIYHAEVKG